MGWSPCAWAAAWAPRASSRTFLNHRGHRGHRGILKFVVKSFFCMASVVTLRSPRVNEITRTISGAAMKVHSALGPGLLESAYEACLLFELHKSGLKVEAQ